jgi:hypothetical protein
MYKYTSELRADKLGISHSYVVNERLNRHCNVQIDIGIRADELGNKAFVWLWITGKS